MGMASTTTASLRRLRRQGGQHACVIGPEGPIIVEPEGSTDGTPEGVLLRLNGGRPEGQPASSGLIVELSGLMARLQSSLKA